MHKETRRVWKEDANTEYITERSLDGTVSLTFEEHVAGWVEEEVWVLDSLPSCPVCEHAWVVSDLKLGCQYGWEYNNLGETMAKGCECKVVHAEWSEDGLQK